MGGKGSGENMYQREGLSPFPWLEMVALLQEQFSFLTVLGSRAMLCGLL